MNIFVLDEDPIKAARMQCDKHVVKMTLETAQMLCAAIWRNGGTASYKASYKSHPCTVWTGDSLSNFKWLWRHGMALPDEFSIRFLKAHKSSGVISDCLPIAELLHSCGKFPDLGMTARPLCMPDKYKGQWAVESYRRYYLGDKSKFAKWKLGNQPEWWSR